jgi:hypothetical protein
MSMLIRTSTSTNMSTSMVKNPMNISMVTSTIIPTVMNMLTNMDMRPAKRNITTNTTPLITVPTNTSMWSMRRSLISMNIENVGRTT